MKAKVIKTGEVIEVHRNISGWASDDQLNKTRLFDESDLDFDYQDWELFRREAAKDILQSIIVTASQVYEMESLDKSIWCEQAIEWADTLIAKLKEKWNYLLKKISARFPSR